MIRRVESNTEIAFFPLYTVRGYKEIYEDDLIGYP